MSNTNTNRPAVIMAGAGIDGIAAAQSLACLGLPATVLEQFPRLVRSAQDCNFHRTPSPPWTRSVSVQLCARTVFTERMIMMGAAAAREVGAFEVGAAFRARFNIPYSVIHRADIHTAILEQLRDTPNIELITSCEIDASNRMTPASQ